MLHTKFQGHWPFGSGEAFFKSFIVFGHGGHLGHVIRTVWTNFRSPIPWRLHLASIVSVVSEEKMFENVNNIHTRTTQTYLYYKLTNEPKGSGELKMKLVRSISLFSLSYIRFEPEQKVTIGFLYWLLDYFLFSKLQLHFFPASFLNFYILGVLGEPCTRCTMVLFSSCGHPIFPISDILSINPSHAVWDLSHMRQYPPWLLFTTFVDSVGYPRYNQQKTCKTMTHARSTVSLVVGGDFQF